jgi:hypothetical protein
MADLDGVLFRCYPSSLSRTPPPYYTDNFEMQHIEFKSSELWTIKLVELRKALEGNCLEKSVAILNCWTSLPEAFTYLKKVAFAFL